jgi:cytochrome c2
VRHLGTKLTVLAVAAVSIGLLAFQQHASAREKRREVAEALANGDATRGSLLYAKSGCGACHAMQNRGLPQGHVGPDLTGIARRAYIAGRLSNRPENLANWIANPMEIDLETAMPDVGLTLAEARDIAAYLYSE